MVALYDGQLKGCVAPPVRNIDTRSHLQQSGNYVRLSVEDSEVESCPLVVVDTVHILRVTRLVHQGQDGLRLATDSSVVQGSI